MPTATRPDTMESALLHPATRLGHVHLTVNNLERQIAFYTQVLAMTLHWREGAEAALGSESEVLLRLSEDPTARRVERAAGMYHFAILYPSRKELARAIARLFALRYPNAPTDQGISKTTYLDDLEGNNIELYVRSLDDGRFEMVNGQMIVRYAEGRIGSGRDPLDVEALFRELEEGERLDLPLPSGSQIGHVHLYASSLDASMHFYSNILGFQAGMMSQPMRMGDVGLDEQQNHVIAFNTWKGEGIPPAPEHALGMRHFTLVPPGEEDLERVVGRLRAAAIPLEESPEGIAVYDPSRIKLILTRQMLPTEQPAGGQSTP